jgi:hypothetical protein
MAIPALMQLVELVLSFLGFSAWPPSNQLTVRMHSMNSTLNARLNSAWKTLATTSFS